MNKKVILILVAILLLAVVSISIFRYYHPTYFTFNDRFVIGSTEAQIVERYGAFYARHENESGELIRATYMIHDNTPELIMSYDDSLWYDIYFEEEIAVRVELREGRPGG